MLVESCVGDDAGGVVEEGDEEDLEWLLVTGKTQVGSVKGVDLPEVVCVGLGEGESAFGDLGGARLEELVFIDRAPEGVGGDLVAPEVALLDAGAVEGLDVQGTLGVCTGAKGREGLFNGGQNVLGGDFAQGPLVRSGGRIGDAVVSVVIPPGLDGSPGELAWLTFFVLEDHLADGSVAGAEAVAGSMFEGSEDAHFEIVGDTFHRRRRRCQRKSPGMNVQIVLPEFFSGEARWVLDERVEKKVCSER